MNAVGVIREAFESMSDVPAETVDFPDGSEVLEFAPVSDGEEQQ